MLPNIKNKNTGTHLTGLVSTYSPTKNVATARPIVSPSVPNFNENRNTGTHLTGFVPGVPSQSPRPFGIQQPEPQQRPYEPQQRPYGGQQEYQQGFGQAKPQTPHQQSFGQPQHQQFGYHPPQTYPKVPPPLETGLKPPPTSYQPFGGQPTSTSFKPPRCV